MNIIELFAITIIGTFIGYMMGAGIHKLCLKLKEKYAIRNIYR